MTDLERLVLEYASDLRANHNGGGDDEPLTLVPSGVAYYLEKLVERSRAAKSSSPENLDIVSWLEMIALNCEADAMPEHADGLRRAKIEIERLRRRAQQPFADPTGYPPAADWALVGADALTGEAPVASAPTNAQSPLRRAETLRLELEKIAWMDEFLDAAGAREMMNIARDAVRADESTVTKTVLYPDAGGK